MIPMDSISGETSTHCHPLADIQHRSLMTTSSTLPITQAHKHDVKSETRDYDKYRPYFGWVNTDTIWVTFKNTTQWGVSVATYLMKRHLKC